MHQPQMTLTLQTFKKLTAYWVIALLFVSLAGLLVTPLTLLPLSYCIYTLLHGCIDVVRTCGPVYWIGRVDSRWASIGKGTMHQLSPPWKKGTGIYIAIAKRSLQIGLCHSQNFDEVDGTLSAIQGRYLDLEPKEIGQW